MTDTATPPTQEPQSDPLIDGIVDSLMTHAAPNGAIDYPKAAAAFAQLLAEMIGPQELRIRKTMVADFNDELTRAIQMHALRTSMIDGGKR